MAKYVGAVILALLALTAIATGKKEESLEQLIARADAAKPEQQPDLYGEVAEREMKALNDSYTGQRWDEFRSELQDLVKYCDKAHSTAIHARKHVKKTEIRIRKISERLHAIKFDVDVDDQPQVQTAIDRLETFRSELLANMFGLKGKNND
jgi:predicted DNA binding CopG/RHH family protein